MNTKISKIDPYIDKWLDCYRQGQKYPVPVSQLAIGLSYRNEFNCWQVIKGQHNPMNTLWIEQDHTNLYDEPCTVRLLSVKGLEKFCTLSKKPNVLLVWDKFRRGVVKVKALRIYEMFDDSTDTHPVPLEEVWRGMGYHSAQIAKSFLRNLDEGEEWIAIGDYTFRDNRYQFDNRDFYLSLSGIEYLLSNVPAQTTLSANLS